MHTYIKVFCLLLKNLTNLNKLKLKRKKRKRKRKILQQIIDKK